MHYTSQDLTRNLVMQSKVKALILDLVHHMDVVAYLDKARCEALSDWAWHKQLRYYLRDDGTNTAEIRMCDASFNYTYEYQGNAPKLVHTPLTDKCYLTLTQGMHMGFGGNPYGPAGTGKTESVKALGNAFGRQVLVFNCDEGIDFQSMGRIFIGLVKCGAWGCFDEFNRLKEDQLSAISQQIQIIQDAHQAQDAADLPARPHDPGRPQRGHLRHAQPGGQGLRRPLEPARQPQGALPPGRHGAARQRAHLRGDALLGGLLGREGPRGQDRRALHALQGAALGAAALRLGLARAQGGAQHGRQARPGVQARRRAGDAQARARAAHQGGARQHALQAHVRRHGALPRADRRRLPRHGLVRHRGRRPRGRDPRGDGEQGVRPVGRRDADPQDAPAQGVARPAHGVRRRGAVGLRQVGGLARTAGGDDQVRPEGRDPRDEPQVDAAPAAARRHGPRHARVVRRRAHRRGAQSRQGAARGAELGSGWH